MRSNIVKMIKIIFISSLFSIVAACSSGSSGSDEGLDITRTFTGTIGILIQNDDLALEVRDFNVVATFAQESTGTIGAQTSEVDANISIVGFLLVHLFLAKARISYIKIKTEELLEYSSV